MRVVIIEDEIRAANRLEKLVLICEPEALVLAKLESVAESVAFFETEKEIDLIFSDIQLADDLSFEIFKQVRISAPIIFTTAYDAYAIDAFKTNGIDYLLKPIEEQELKAAIAKFKTLTKATGQIPDMKQLMALMNQAAAAQQVYKKRFLVKVGTQIKSIPIADIQAFYSKDKSNYILSNQRSYPIEQPLDQLEVELNPHQFFRINRGFIINLDANPSISAYSNSRLKITLPGLENELIIVAREKTKEFKKWLGE